MIPARNARDDIGSVAVVSVTVVFVLMAGSLLWLSRTVDRSLHDRDRATAVAYDAARAGAQALDTAAIRRGESTIDPAVARQRVLITAATELARSGDTGSVTGLAIEADRVTVTVTITTTGRHVTGTASAASRVGVDGPDT